MQIIIIPKLQAVWYAEQLLTFKASMELYKFFFSSTVNMYTAILVSARVSELLNDWNVYYAESMRCLKDEKINKNKLTITLMSK